MRKLLSANFYAMSRSLRFWLGVFMMAATAVYAGVDARKMLDMNVNNAIDANALLFVPLLFLVLPALGALFINTDYHDGIIRNKITVGRSRTAVYLANLISVYLSGLFYMAVYTVIFLPLSMALGCGLSDPRAYAAKLALLMLVFLSLAAVAVLLASLIASRSVLVVCAFLAFTLMFGSAALNVMLEEPQMIDDFDGVMMTTETDNDGRVIMQYTDSQGNPISPEDMKTIPNPRYIPQPWRGVLRTVNDVQPGGQMWEILQNGHTDYMGSGSERLEITVQTPYWLIALYALAVTLVSTAAGLALFSRKDIK